MINIAKEVNDYRKNVSIEELARRRNIIKLNGKLKTVQKGARVRTITAEKILSYLACLERDLHIPRRYLNGLKVRIDCNAQDYAKAYNGTPYSTQFEAEYHNGWKIVSIERCEAKRNGRKHKYDILAISDEAKEKIIENVIKRDINW